MIEFRKNKVGWTLRIWFIFIRWNKQDNYTELSVSKISKEFKHIGEPSNVGK